MDKELLKEMKKVIKINDLEKIKIIIDDNPGVLNEVTTSGTFLHVAAIKGQYDAANYLIKRGIDVNKTGGTGDVYALTEAAFEGYLNIVELLYNNGAVLDTSTFARNPLFAAIYNHHIDVAKYLIDKGIDLSVTYPIGSIDNCDAREYARQYGCTEIVNYIDEKVKSEQI
ncbi:ankyrin repeat domain-containing protein [Butyrivibrio fibrisolvens]|uniref:ankyrin repeat domain-containing protein n=1 Tax=Butyrivibrio fibrisolvens TaxID=831 RepID=UPI0020BD5D79|nr:ankyrin repeat domain-containing protein [Butyrivibrio fibrisolvens]